MTTKVPANMTVEAVTAAQLAAKADTTALALKADANATVNLTGNQTIAGTKTFSSQPVLPEKLTRDTAKATTSGTSIDFPSIPSWVKRIVVMFNGVSTSGTSHWLVKVGSGGTPTSTGYLGTSCGVATAGTAAGVTSTAGLPIYCGNASNVVNGSLTLLNVSDNIWVSSHAVSTSTGQSLAVSGGGGITLAAVLDNIRLTTVNGTDTFDAGSVNILYE